MEQWGGWIGFSTASLDTVHNVRYFAEHEQHSTKHSPEASVADNLGRHRRRYGDDRWPAALSWNWAFGALGHGDLVLVLGAI
ncbi:MAG: hypothetical protein ACI9UK_000037 [Candidatus Krumholzibacteriia bacterium]|jgi:hypothetical protein